MEIHPDFKELLKLFNENKVQYLVVGGYAVNFYGYPRYTEDFDLLVLLTPENANKIILTLKEFGFGSLGLSNSDFLKKENVIQLGKAPFRIDIMTSADGIDFESAYSRKTIHRVASIEIPIISLDDLIKNKMTTARSQDIADIEGLRNINQEQE